MHSFCFHLFSKSAKNPVVLLNVVYNSFISYSSNPQACKNTKRPTVWIWDVSITGQWTSCDFIVLYGTFDSLDLKSWSLLLFQFCPLIGFHCLGGPGFSGYTVKTYDSSISILAARVSLQQYEKPWNKLFSTYREKFQLISWSPIYK